MAGRVYLHEDTAAEVQRQTLDKRRAHRNGLPQRPNELRYNAPEWQFVRNDSLEPDEDGYYQATVVLWDSQLESFVEYGEVWLRNAND